MVASVPDMRLTFYRIPGKPTHRILIYWSEDRRSDVCRLIRQMVFDQDFPLTYRAGEALIESVCTEDLFHEIAKSKTASPTG